MSRTRKSTKAPGSEPWSRRPFNKGGGTNGAYHKHRTHKAERAEGRDDCAGAHHAAQQEDSPTDGAAPND